MKRNFSGLNNDIRSESGQTLVLVALSMTVLMGFLGLAIDVGNVRSTEHRLQAVADAAALAGAIEVSYCNGTALCDEMKTAVKNAATENGFTYTFSTSTCTQPAAGSGSVLLLNNGPCLISSPTDPNNGNAKTVETLAQVDQTWYFGRVFGLQPARVWARAEAGLGNFPGCLIGLQGMQVSSGGQVSAPNCGAFDGGNLTRQNGGTGACNGSHIDVLTFQVDGSACNSNQITPTPVTNAPAIPDPLAYITSSAPTAGSCTVLPSGWTSNKSAGTGATYNLSPGTYCANSSHMALEINTGDTVNLVPTSTNATFIFMGDVQLDSQANLNGNGVTMYFGGTGSTGGSVVITANNTSVNLIAPTNTCASPTSTYLPGILMWEGASDSETFSLIDGNKSIWQGSIYVPNGTIDAKSGSNLGAYTILDAKNIILGDGGQVNVGANYSSLSCGSPARGATAVLVE